MYNINTILIIGNITLSIIALGVVLGLSRVKFRLDKSKSLVNEVGPIPPPQPVPQPVPEIVPTPIGVKEDQPKQHNQKTKKQIDLLTKELERLQSL